VSPHRENTPYGSCSSSGRLDHGTGPFDGRPPVTQVPGDLVTDGPLSFRHCGGMTEGRLSEYASFLGLDRLPYLQGVYGQKSRENHLCSFSNAPPVNFQTGNFRPVWANSRKAGSCP